MKNKHLFSSLLIALLAFSCSSDDDGNPFSPVQLKLKSFAANADRHTVSYADDKPISITKPNGTDILLDYNLAGKLIKFGDYLYDYDASGTLISVRNTDGICNFEYNSQGLISKQNISTNTQVSITRRFTYNNTSNKLVSIRETDNIIGNADMTKITIIYNDKELPSSIIFEESRDNSSSFYGLFHMVIRYETLNNPLSLFKDKLGFNSDIIPLFDNPLNTRASSKILLGRSNYFLLNYITPNAVGRSSQVNTSRQEYFDYISENNYPTTALYREEDDLGIYNTIEYSWEYIAN